MRPRSLREKHWKYQKKWRRENPKKWRAITRRWYEKARVRDKMETFAILGDSCKRCGYNDPRALCVDHVKNDGRHDRACRSGIRNRLNAIKKNPKRYQILCANCNMIKELERKR